MKRHGHDPGRAAELRCEDPGPACRPICQPYRRGPAAACRRDGRPRCPSSAMIDSRGFRVGGAAPTSRSCSPRLRRRSAVRTGVRGARPDPSPPRQNPGPLPAHGPGQWWDPEGGERIAGCWAEARKVPRVAGEPVRIRHRKAAPLAGEDRIAARCRSASSPPRAPASPATWSTRPGPCACRSGSTRRARGNAAWPIRCRRSAGAGTARRRPGRAGSARCRDGHRCRRSADRH